MKVKIMKVKIKLLSYTLTGSGEGVGIIDSDVVLDDFGFPYIPSRRIKGVLKESSQEVCDILGLNYDIVESVFGKDGFTKGKVHIGNLYVNNYENIRKEIDNLKKDKNSIYNIFINPSQIASYYTTIRQQTSIDEKSEIAKENSLRTFRVLKPSLEFEGEIYEITPLSKKEKALLYLAAVNLKRIGTSRNRGFGEISCLIEDVDIRDVDGAIQCLNRDDDIKEENNSSDLEKFNANKKGSVKKLSYKITTLSPIVLAREVGEQNTINTEKYIPSTTVRGLFANRFIKKFNLGRSAHQDENFYNLFLKNEIIFTPAYPYKGKKTYYPALYLHKEKGKDDNVVYNILEKNPDTTKTKPLKKMIYYLSEDEGIYTYDVSTTFYFHNARDREKGHSTEEEIFYYEAINEGEKFEGFIIGDEGYLEEIKKIYSEKFASFIGRSKSAQYGLVNIEFVNIEDTDDLEDTLEDMEYEFTIVATSPVILYNESGFSDISIKALKHYLEKHFACKVDVEKIVARTEYVENFVGIWGMKNTRELAYSPGSAFKIKISGCNDLKEKLNNLLKYGFGEKTELGFGRVNVYSSLEESYQIYFSDSDKNEKVPPQHSKSILENIVKQKTEELIKSKAFKKAKEFSDQRNVLNISNHLIGRPAGETLKSIDLWDGLLKLDISDKYKSMFYDKLSTAIEELKLDLEQYNFELSKIYWISFFRYLRLFKKDAGDKNG
jgi:CRISPR-associated protein Csx10